MSEVRIKEWDPGQWAVSGDIAESLGVADNEAAFDLVSESMKESNPELRSRMDFQGDHDLFWVFFASPTAEDDAKELAEIVTEMCDGKPARRNRRFVR